MTTRFPLSCLSWLNVGGRHCGGSRVERELELSSSRINVECISYT